MTKESMRREALHGLNVALKELSCTCESSLACPYCEVRDTITLLTVGWTGIFQDEPFLPPPMWKFRCPCGFGGYLSFMIKADAENEQRRHQPECPLLQGTTT